jgi:hypothetical protein
MKIKNLYKGLGLLLIPIALSILSSCNQDVDLTPSIARVRVTAKDSVITGGEFGLSVAIQGNNLASVVKVMFNDLEAELNPTLITNNNIICFVPDVAPNVVSNKVTVITKGGQSAQADFNVVLPEPIITGMYNEFAKGNEITEVLGNYFYLIKSVKLGSTNLEIISFTPTSIKVKMPATVIKDKITVEGEGGTVTSTFRMHETDGNMVNFDIPATGWGSPVCWGGAAIVDGSDPDALSGKFSRINDTNLPKTGWQDSWVFSTCWFDFGLAAGAAESKTFKFEHKIDTPWITGQYDFEIKTENGTVYKYSYKPWNDSNLSGAGFKTTGWKTAYIPLTEFKNGQETIQDVSKIRDLLVAFKTPDAGMDAYKGSIDNIRIVNK